MLAVKNAPTCYAAIRESSYPLFSSRSGPKTTLAGRLNSTVHKFLASLSSRIYSAPIGTPMALKHTLFGGITSATQDRNHSLYPLPTIDRSGARVDLSQYRGQLVLIVNTASQCGFARQYDALEVLHKKYAGRGLVVLGFPSNDFMGQEPDSDEQIEVKCRINHGVSFPLFPKASVKGPNKQSVFSALTTQGPPDLRGEVRWNFEKFLLDRDGRLVGRWRSWVHPGWGIFERAIVGLL